MAAQTNALDLLKADHRNVLALVQKFEKTDDEREQRELCSEIMTELHRHNALEEEIFYPYLREVSADMRLLDEAAVEHAAADSLMHDLENQDQDAGHFRATVRVLGEYLKIHVHQEEDELFPKVKKLGIDLEALGQELAEQKKRLEQEEKPHSARAAGERKAHGKQAKKSAEPAHEPADTSKEDERFLKEHGDELSKSTQRAKWIHSVDEHEDHSGQTLATRNPDVIRHWAEERGGKPATTPGGDTERPRVLRFNFPDYDKNLQEISWEAWLRTFDERELVFIYQEHMKAGNMSNFFRLDSPHREDG